LHSSLPAARKKGKCATGQLSWGKEKTILCFHLKEEKKNGLSLQTPTKRKRVRFEMNGEGHQQGKKKPPHALREKKIPSDSRKKYPNSYSDLNASKKKRVLGAGSPILKKKPKVLSGGGNTDSEMKGKGALAHQ